MLMKNILTSEGRFIWLLLYSNYWLFKRELKTHGEVWKFIVFLKESTGTQEYLTSVISDLAAQKEVWMNEWNTLFIKTLYLNEFF
jgi:hypothetical protein